MIETFLKKNWRTAIFLGVFLFAWFVWPTPYKSWMEKKDNSEYMRYMRVNRFSGNYEAYWFSLGEWRPWDGKGWDQASQDVDQREKSEKAKKQTASKQKNF